MKTALFTAAAAALTLAGANPALAGPEPRVEIRNAVARVVVIVEDREDIAVEVEMGSADLQRPTVRTAGSTTIIDGGLGSGRGMFGNRRVSVQNCTSGLANASQLGEGASVVVRGHGRINLLEAPLIVVRTPRAVNVESSVGISGAIGRGATSVELSHGGCGDWTVANVDGPVDINLGGSGDLRLGTSRSLDVALGGSGSLVAGRTGDLDFALGGSGGARIAGLDGRADIAIGGSGEVTITNGHARRLDVAIGGSGDVTFGGTVVDADITIAGSGDVRLGEVTGELERTVIGSGTVTVGR